MSGEKYTIQISDADRFRFREMSQKLTAYDILNNTEYLSMAYPHMVEFVFKLGMTRYIENDEVLGMINQCILEFITDKENAKWFDMSVEKLQRYLIVSVKNNFITLFSKENNRKALLYKHYISSGLIDGKDYIEQRIENRLDGDFINAVDKLIKKDQNFLTEKLKEFWFYYKQDLEVVEICTLMNILPNNYYQLNRRFIKSITSKVFNSKP
jgi:hypothetical protein